MSRRLLVLAAVLALAGALTSCGGSSSSSTVGAVTRAADVTGNVAGYRIAGTATVTTPAGSVQTTIAGTFDRTTRTAQMTASENLGGHRLQFSEILSGLTVYMRTPPSANLAKVTGGKPWLKYDMSRLLGAMGLNALPTTTTDPTQFVDYLRAASSSTTRIGTATVRGVNTVHYRATISFDRYPNLVAPSQRAQAARSVSTLESVAGSHTMPMDVWVDAGNRVRRIGLSFSECIQGQRLPLAMTMDLYDYGAQTPPTLPAAADIYDLTPLLEHEVSKLALQCHASA